MCRSEFIHLCVWNNYFYNLLYILSPIVLESSPPSVGFQGLLPSRHLPTQVLAKPPIILLAVPCRQRLCEAWPGTGSSLCKAAWNRDPGCRKQQAEFMGEAGGLPSQHIRTSSRLQNSALAPLFLSVWARFSLSSVSPFTETALGKEEHPLLSGKQQCKC